MVLYWSETWSLIKTCKKCRENKYTREFLNRMYLPSHFCLILKSVNTVIFSTDPEDIKNNIVSIVMHSYATKVTKSFLSNTYDIYENFFFFSILMYQKSNLSFPVLKSYCIKKQLKNKWQIFTKNSWNIFNVIKIIVMSSTIIITND